MIHTIPDLHKLKNGIRILTFPLGGTETITALILVKVGSRNEPEKLQGISHFLEHLLFKGTKKRPTPVDIAREIEAVGGYFNAFTTKEYTGFFITTAARHLTLVLDILSDILTSSLFQSAEIERERKVILEEMRLYFDTPSEYIGEVFESLLYTNSALGKDIVGTFETVGAISRDDVLPYIKTHYTGPNIVVSLSGKLANTDTKKAQEVFSAFSNGKEGRFEGFVQKQHSPCVLIKEKATDQAHIAIGVRTFSFNDKRRETLDLLATLLGAEKSSRMFQEVRDKLGLAYYIGTEPTYYGDVGYLATFAGVNIDNIDLAIKTILREYQRVREEGVGEKELFQAKEYIKGRLLIELESSFRMARLVGSRELLLKERESLKEYFSRLDAITKESIKEVARSIFLGEHLNLAVIGPFNDQERFTKLLNLDHR